MLRALFFREFRKSWLIHAGLFAAFSGTLTVLAEFELLDASDKRNLSFLTAAGLVVSAFISGERCFSAAFKKGRYYFLLTMPAPRGSIWSAYIGGRLLGALTALPVVLPIRPVLLKGLSPPPVLVVPLAMYLVYFFAGAALALAVRKEILVYLLGFPLVTKLLLMLYTSASWGYEPTYLPWEIPKRLYAISLGSLVLALVQATCARHTFCRGEPLLLQRNARALTEGGLAFAAFAALTITVWSNTSLAALDDEWQPATPAGIYPYNVHPVSPDGRFQFIFQQLRWRKDFKRLAVVDLENGLLSNWFEMPSLHQISWSPTGNVLEALATNNTPLDCLGRCEGSTTWYRLTTDLHVLSAQELKEPLGSSFPETLETVEAQRPGSFPVISGLAYAASQEGFDRVVLAFQGSRVPGYRIGYVDPPAVRCGSGEPVEIAGAALLQVRLVPATTRTKEGYTTVPSSPGTRPGLPVVQEIDMVCNFEDNVTWVLGLSARNRFRVHELAEPARLVINIEHGR